MKLTNIIKESKTIQRENKGPCWDGYQQIGMKMKGGKEVPNCVPKNEVTELNDRKVYIDYLNKKKGFKQDRIKFNSYEDAVKWAKKNFERFSPDMIKFESVSEATTSSQPGEWVAYLSMTRGKKLLNTFNTARGAKQFLSKNVDKLLGGANVESVGIMSKKQWDEREAKYAIENVNELNVNKKFGSKYDIGAGSMGSGTTFWNKAQEVSGDYKTIAHVSDNGKVTFYDKKLPNDVKKHIEDYAKTKTESVKENCGCGGVKTSNSYSLSEFVINEAGGIPKMFKVYLGLQNKVRELEDVQKQLLQPYLNAKKSNNVTAMNKAVEALKKNQKTLDSFRKNLSKVETKYIENLDRDVEYEG